MNRAMTAPVLEPVGEGRVVLQAVNVEAEIENLLCQVTIKQLYRNMEKVNIESVYTFPLPLGAVLLGMTIKTLSSELKGVVVERSKAEDRYEDAIIDGDMAIMLEQVEPGLYTMNVGNLLPEETIEISITYAELFKWQDNSLRFFLPTTIAPRYGDPESIGIQPYQTPEYELTSENQFSITVAIFGTLAGASIKSPSHKIVSESLNAKTIVSLKKGKALMDRDFILNLCMENDEKSVAHVESDGYGHTALASFYPRIPTINNPTPQCITIIVDCSGSMSGDSISQTRKALYEILGMLRPEDMFNIIRFGSSYQMLFPMPMFADASNLKKAKNLLEVLNADMGGTEIGQAIASAIRGKPHSKTSREVLLITDGEVWDWEQVTAMASESGVRFFTVGVGSSVSEAFVQTLADHTGGSCELVSPMEDMAEKIVRHFKRIYTPKSTNVKIHWPSEPENIFPKQINTIYDGDTLHVFGKFKKMPKGEVELRADLNNGETFIQKLPLHNRAHFQTPSELPGTTARMATAFEIKTMEDPKQIANLGMKYQLMSKFTNYLAIDVKVEGEKVEAIPVLHKTPQMLAAGWGGSGTIMQDMSIQYSIKKSTFLKSSMENRLEGMDSCCVYLERRKYDPFIDRLNNSQDELFKPLIDITSINDLRTWGVPDEQTEVLMELVNAEVDEETAVKLFFYLLLQQKRFIEILDRSIKRILVKAYKKLPVVPEGMRQRVKTTIETYLQTIGN